MSETLRKQLELRAWELSRAKADDTDRHLSVVARLSREDGELMKQAAAALAGLTEAHFMTLETIAKRTRKAPKEYTRAPPFAFVFDNIQDLKVAGLVATKGPYSLRVRLTAAGWDLFPDG